MHTLRFYEKEGLFRPVVRDTAGRRVYDDEDLDWLEVCIRLRASGMPLPDIRRYNELVRQGQGNEGERLDLLRRHQERVRGQIGELSACLDLITEKVGVYEGRISGCSLA
ncbi:MerR family transcriptional regulator [Nonomuraea sp. NBC_01738]|uniref:MerR family transcriptional regulator n=1 Tax=Nonomuraea sp. NBC_01738 TaxID=2976003 RepID=UPI002E0EE33D|nr:MerR family transcriptional regulator [Nonomuraea sp. NBC_01738]